MAEKRLLLIDGNSIAFRAFYALYKSLDRFTNAEGLHTTAIYGFNTMLDTMLAKVNPTNALVAFDAGKTTFRTEMFSDYKGQRDKTASELSEQLPFIHDLLAARGIQSYELKDYEADDIIGTLACQADQAGYTTTIVTGDRDLKQLATDQTTVAVSKRGVTEVDLFNPVKIHETMGITPIQIIDVKALQGDASDNYPGVEKVGPKTAQTLIQDYGSVEGVYDHLDEVSGKKLKEHLISGKENALLGKKLATIIRDAPLTIGLEDTKYDGIHREELIAFYEKMNFQSFLNRMPMTDGEPKPVAESEAIKYTELTEDNLDQLGDLSGTVDFYLEMIDENYHTSAINGFAIGQDGHWFVSRNASLIKRQEIRGLLENSEVKKDVFDAKRTYVGLRRLGVDLKNVDFDLLLVSYLLNTNDNSNDLGKVAKEHGYQQIPTDEAVYGRGAKREIPMDDLVFFEHLARKLKAVADLRKQLLNELDRHEQTRLYYDIELPIAVILAQMEIEGITVQAETLEAMGSKLSERIAELEQVIYQEAGEEFNIGSPKQLGHILFEQMGLTPLKKTKTGYSTSVDVLEQLAAEAPIVENILKYRQITKIQHTYVEGLLKVISPTDHKVHTRYLQTLTQTGRLSSVDPNLQNIPVRSDEGRQIRQAFVPRHKGWKIFSSDYSQIELRVLASISHDQNMQDAFKNGEDIHAATARRIFGLSSNDEVTPDLRRQAKAVNFGIVYGISDYGLSKNIGISRKDARTFIDKYFAEYPDVKKYTEDVVKAAEETGYVETIAHRRRYLPDINSKNFNKRSFAERTAMNTPIQGSAADIIKIAMIHMQEALKDYQATMLLQVHDELIFEAPEEEISQLEKLVPSIMDSAVHLDVPLKVESHYGDTWYDAK
ncbi:DNA polymerase I [Levilactobacillus bambusae]|uniref:DNA polymerase I n=1 Tax=Levilactobacillus bambusae TaxID=2024736 RepID=A0A2V1N194_9LACO|nr:DNA polymerase I [Levilactobacillus bambusae]PWG01039.1 DNA polymerase I [Levilactobacillus bambusae]